jgi:GDPmannose 4,6-dehydratase
MFTCNGILFNHESPRRGENFVTRKITMAVANIVSGKQEKLSLGNMNAKRDWGFAGDYVQGMWLMLQQDKPGDYVLATKETHTVREFVEAAFGELNIRIRWDGEGVNEKGYDAETGKLLVDVNPEFYRPSEVEFLWGNCAKAEKELGWKRKTGFRALVAMMMDSDMKDIAGVSCEEYRKGNKGGGKKPE